MKGDSMYVTYGCAENTAAIAYGMKGMTNRAGLTFYEQRCDELEGEAGMLFYFVECGEAFEEAEMEIALHDVDPGDWYLAVDAFCIALISADDLPRNEELKAMALAAIAATIDTLKPTATGEPT